MSRVDWPILRHRFLVSDWRRGSGLSPAKRRRWLHLPTTWFGGRLALNARGVAPQARHASVLLRDHPG